ncbi:MAG: transketolase [Candidatus Thorarchaeota archaeon]|nr:transketolase [Candidatus Thorarchaeota archaeon]
MTPSNSLQEKAINAVRFLSADAIEDAKSGHPGMPMGAAAMAYALWMRHLRFNPRNPDWPNRDRFVLSGGHGSMLLYSLLHLTGYDLPLEEIKNFRQWQSKTPGHPEYGCTPGVEVTTGPLGQGLGNSVGLAIAEAHLAAIYNQPGHEVVDHFTYAIVTDGDLMEGISSEAASLAGHLGLKKLILLYDDNHISIDGETDITFTENTKAKYEALNWHVQVVANGNDVDGIDAAISEAKKASKPSLIMCRTSIGFGMPNKQDTSKAHGEPAGEAELNGAKEKLGWPLEPRYYIPDDVLSHFRESINRGDEKEKEWKNGFANYKADFPDLGEELERRCAGRLPDGWNSEIVSFDANPKGIATRAASGKVINAFAKIIPELIGGSADLTGSNKTWIDSSIAFQKDSPEGRNIYFGVREHAMGAITNGLSVHGGFIPYSATFFMFSDYMRPAIRLAALSDYPSIWIFTHDSIGVGEDGPTHQPIEHLASLRAIPNLVVIRPADANEVVYAWEVAISRRHAPTVIVLTRQTVPIVDRTEYKPAENLKRGAYVIADLSNGNIDLIIMASGSEVHPSLEAAKKLASEGIGVRVVSFPSWKLFEAQSQDYQDSVLPPEVSTRLAVEVGVKQGWERWIGDKGDMISIDRFGSSAPGNVLFEKFGFSVENIVKRAKDILS